LDPPSGSTLTPGDEWDHLLSVADRFEEAWKGSENVDLLTFLPPPGTPLRSAVLQELVKTEMEVRCRRGLPVELEDYVARFPELGTLRSLPARLIYEEYRVRQLYGDRPPLNNYRERFPQQFSELRHLLREQPLPTSAGPPAPPSSNSPKTNEVAALGEVLPPNEGYRLLERIGSGQYGEVFRANAPGGADVAVKRIFRAVDDEASQRELQALELIRSLRHTFLLQTHRYWALKDRVVMVMELADDSLSDWYRACKADGKPGIPAPELIAYLREAAEALDYMHSKGVLHRDIKPGNLLRLSGHAKVADFGLARLQESQVMSATFCGTPVYMAPEVWQGKISVNSDQYSLAVTYFEMRFGRRPFAGMDPLELGMQHLRETPDLTGAGGRETRVLLRALSKEPEDRYPSCREFVSELAAATGPPPPPPEKFPWALTVVAVGLLTLVVVALFTLVVPRDDANRNVPTMTPPSSGNKERP
jgi:serine/threonine protein kinase